MGSVQPFDRNICLLQGVREWNGTDDRKVYKTETDIKMNGFSTPTGTNSRYQPADNHDGDLYALPDRKAKISKFVEEIDSGAKPSSSWKKTTVTPVQSSLKKDFRQARQPVDDSDVPNYQKPSGPVYGDQGTLTRAGMS
jgi:hypothetical protein